MGAHAELLSGGYTLSQARSLALHNHPSMIDGIAYRARHDLEQTCAAIFERAAGGLSTTLLGSFADSSFATRLADLLERYDYGLA